MKTDKIDYLVYDNKGNNFFSVQLAIKNPANQSEWVEIFSEVGQDLMPLLEKQPLDTFPYTGSLRVTNVDGQVDEKQLIVYNPQTS